MASTERHATMSVEDYYSSPFVRARVLEYCGGSAAGLPTAAFVAELTPDTSPTPSWDRAPRVPMAGIDAVWTRGHDLARSCWDSANLLFLVDLDYQNIDTPSEPFLRPADVFFKIEPAYQAAVTVFRSLGIHVRPVMTGRGYHFIGQVPLDDPIVDSLAAILPRTPAWFVGVEARRSPGVTTPMSERQARAAAGLGCLIEYTAHLILNRARGGRLPVVLNGIVVGSSGLVGRECASIDFSHVGDPLDIRHARVAFGTYQWHRVRPDIFGSHAASQVPPTAALPRGRESLMMMLTRGRDLAAASRAARRTTARLPNVARGIERLLSRYEASALGDFHRRFYAELEQTRGPVKQLDLAAIPPCVSAAFRRPNDLLLKPEHIQHVVRGLMSRGWTPAQIARLVQSAYEADHGWGDRWVARMEPATRAEFDVRVFAGLIDIHSDGLEDFNCVSAQEKNICPRVGCPYDLRIDRDHLVSSTP